MPSHVVKPNTVASPIAASAARASDAAVAERLWFAPAWTMLPLARRRCLVRNPDNGASIELDSGEYAVLSTCEGCRTLAEHEAHAAYQLSAPAAHRPAIRELLERCARTGLLTALPDMVARFGAANGPSVGPIAGVTVPTADRPGLLLRLLTGAAALQRRTGNAYRWHIFDDSRSAENRSANREAIAACPDLDATHHDLSLPDSLESRLAIALPDLREEIRSLLAAAQPGEVTYGRTRNYSALWFAGRRFLSIDDDALIDPRRPPLTRPGISIGLAPRAAFWYESFDAAFAVCPELAVDPFAEHARWLGLPLAQAWDRAGREPDDLRVGNLPGLVGSYFDPAARVIFTWNHVLGDPGWTKFSGELLTVSAETRDWLAGNPGAARAAFESQVQWRGYSSLQLSPQESVSTTTLCGFDGTVLLPPAVRAGPEADTVIGELTRCIHPTAWVASLPFALPHVRNSRRQYLSPTDDADAFNLNRTFINYARARSPSIRAADPALRLSALGAMLVDLASARDATLREVIAEQAADIAAKLTFAIEAQLDDPATPGTWKDVIRPWLAAPLLQLDSASLARRPAPLDRLRSGAREFGRALIAWPRLSAWCRENPQ